MRPRGEPRPYRLGVLLGDGIGPEIVPAAVRVVDAALAAAGADPVAWQELPVGASAMPSTAAPSRPPLWRRWPTDGWLLGPHDSAAYPEPFRSRLNPSGAIRKHFDLYANTVPPAAASGGTAIAPDTDLGDRPRTPRASTRTGTPAGTGEFMPTADVAICHGVFTRRAVERIARARRAGPAPAEGKSRSSTRRTSCSSRPGFHAGLPRGRRRLPDVGGGRRPHRRHDG